MARRKTGRAGDEWQPIVVRRVAGRTRRQMPKVKAPTMRAPANWKRIAIPIAVVAALSVGAWALYNSPLASIQNVNVQGNTVVSSEVVRSVAGLDGQSIVRPDFESARANLLALPRVKDAEIKRDWPNGATITLTERVPWGLWQAGVNRYVVDEEGVVLDLPVPQDAPLIVQRDATTTTLALGDRVDAGAMDVATQLVATAGQTLDRTVASLEFSRAEGIAAVLTSNSGRPDLRVVFGDAQGYEFKVASLFAVLQQAEEEGRALSRVDLRFGERVAVQ